MMLQGHFIDGLLDSAFRDPNNITFNIWKYFRGITAPVFFTVSGFIFTYLLIRVPEKGFENPRIKKGVKRGLQLLFIAYLLRLNLFGLLKGELYDSFFLVDVLHCIGLSILGIIGVYLLTCNKKKVLFPVILMAITVTLFLLEPLYEQWGFTYLPQAIANYFTKANGSVFTIIPWIGYTAFGGFLSVLFALFKDYKHLYTAAIPLAALTGLSLILFSSDFFLAVSQWTGLQLFADIFFNNYLFIRLGDVLVVFAIFMLFRQFMKNQTLLRIGQNTLSIYVIHFIILYGSFTGLGIYYFLHHSLSPTMVICGAIGFMVLSSYLALRYDTHEERIKLQLWTTFYILQTKIESVLASVQRGIRMFISRLLRVLGFVKP